MRLVPVKLRPGQRLLCVRCRQWISAGVLADLDGVPFRDYYCPACAEAEKERGS